MIKEKKLIEKTLMYFFNQIKAEYKFEPNIQIPSIEVHASRMIRHCEVLMSSKEYQKFEEDMSKELRNIINSLNHNP